VRKWPAQHLGVLKLVCQGKEEFVAEVLDCKKLPSGRSIPESAGLWLSVLGTDKLIKQTSRMRMCVSCVLCKKEWWSFACPSGN
jgi:hypothetical protein